MNTGAQAAGETAAKDVVSELHGYLREGLAGKTFTVALVGPAGVGKSTLVNTLLMRPACQVGRGAAPVTDCVKENDVVIPLRDNGAVTLRVIDSPGFTGVRSNDTKVTSCLRSLGKPDLLLICFGLDSDGGRYMPMYHNFVIQKIRDVWGDEMLASDAVLVLTKCNLVSETYKKGGARFSLSGASSTPSAFIDEVELWKTEYASNQDSAALAGLPIYVAGRMEFSEDDKPTRITNVNGNTGWLQTLWCGVASRTDTGLAPVFYLTADAVRQDSAVDSSVRKDLPIPDKEVMLKVLRFAAQATAVVVTCGTVGVLLLSMFKTGKWISPSTAMAVFGGANKALIGAKDGNYVKMGQGCMALLKAVGSHWSFGIL